MCFIINSFRQQMRTSLPDGEQDGGIYYKLPDSKPDMMGHDRYRVPKLGGKLFSRGSPYCPTVKS